MADKTAFKTEDGKDFAVLQVPPWLIGEICENPNIAEEIKRLIGVRVLIVSQDVNLVLGEMAKSEVKRLHSEIERFLNEGEDAESEKRNEEGQSE